MRYISMAILLLGCSSPATPVADDGNKDALPVQEQRETVSGSRDGSSPPQQPPAQRPVQQPPAQQPPVQQPPEAQLPASFKGYELYAWDEGGELRFVLMTGTNRQKTVAEVTTPAASVETSEWVAIRGAGLDELESVLKRVPDPATILLTGLAGLPALSDEHRAAVQHAIARARS